MLSSTQTCILTLTPLLPSSPPTRTPGGQHRNVSCTTRSVALRPVFDGTKLTKNLTQIQTESLLFSSLLSLNNKQEKKSLSSLLSYSDTNKHFKLNTNCLIHSDRDISPIPFFSLFYLWVFVNYISMIRRISEYLLLPKMFLSDLTRSLQI